MKKYWLFLILLLVFAVALSGCTDSEDDDDDDDDDDDGPEVKNLDHNGYLNMVNESSVDLTLKYVIKDTVTEINTTFTENYIYVKFASSGDAWSLWDTEFPFEVGDTIEWEYYYDLSSYTFKGMHMEGDSVGAWMSLEAKKV